MPFVGRAVHGPLQRPQQGKVHGVLLRPAGDLVEQLLQGKAALEALDRNAQRGDEFLQGPTFRSLGGR